MIDKATTFFERFAKDVGITIKIPRPGKTMRKASVITNSTIGIVLIVGGTIMSKKIMIGLGALGLVGAVVLADDLQK